MEHPHQDKPAVKKYWTDGRHPHQCKGECMITGICGIDFCTVCHWDEYDLLLDNPEKKANQ